MSQELPRETVGPEHAQALGCPACCACLLPALVGAGPQGVVQNGEARRAASPAPPPAFLARPAPHPRPYPRARGLSDPRLCSSWVVPPAACLSSTCSFPPPASVSWWSKANSESGEGSRPPWVWRVEEAPTLGACEGEGSVYPLTCALHPVPSAPRGPEAGAGQQPILHQEFPVPPKGEAGLLVLETRSHGAHPLSVHGLCGAVSKSAGRTVRGSRHQQLGSESCMGEVRLLCLGGRGGGARGPGVLPGATSFICTLHTADPSSVLGSPGDMWLHGAGAAWFP